MNRKYLPLMFMLVSGAITGILTFIRKYTLLKMLICLLAVLIVFYFLGCGVKWMLDTFDKQNQKAALDKGEVIEKDGEEQAEEAQTGQRED